MHSSRRPVAHTGPKPRGRSSARIGISARTSSSPVRSGNLDDLNGQLRHWLDTVANPRVHATTQRVVNEAFAEEKPHLKALPLAPFRSVLKLERRVSHEGMVSVGGNLYSVPDATRKRIVEVHTLADEVRIFEAGTLIATHPVLEGRHQRRVAPGHRRIMRITDRRRHDPIWIVRTGDVVAARPLEFYQAVGQRLACQGDQP
jgi:translation initiation factor IF-1